MRTSPHFIFKSSAFPPEPGEDEEVNPGIFGKALSLWLAAELAQRGYAIKGTMAEDFGRLVEVEASQGRLYVAASSTDESATEWRVFGFAEGGFVARLFGGSGRDEAIARLTDTLRAILRESSLIRDLQEEDAK